MACVRHARQVTLHAALLTIHHTHHTGCQYILSLAFIELCLKYIEVLLESWNKLCIVNSLEYLQAAERIACMGLTRTTLACNTLAPQNCTGSQWQYLMKHCTTCA